VKDFKYVNPNKIENKINNFPIPNGKGILIKIPNPSDEEYLKESSIFDSIGYIKLSNSPNSIIGEINKIVFKDDFIYILDRYKTKALKKFTKTGDFICQIGNTGDGPNDYIEPTDFSITENEIIIYDQFKHRMIFYNFNGTYIRSKKVPFLFLKFHRFSSNKYMFYTVDQDNDHLQSIVNYSLFNSDSCYILRKRGFFRPKNMYKSLFVEDNFCIVENKVYVHPPFSDTIFSVSQANEINIEYILDFGKRKLPIEFTLNQNNKKFNSACEDNFYMIFPGRYVVLNDFVYFEFTKKNVAYRALYSKSTGKLNLGNCIFVDLAPIFPIQNIVTGYKNILVGYIQPYDIVNNLKKIKKEQWSEKLGKKYAHIADELKEGDNPIILFYYLKR